MDETFVVSFLVDSKKNKQKTMDCVFAWIVIMENLSGFQTKNLHVPGSKLLILGMVIPTLIGILII